MKQNSTHISCINISAAQSFVRKFILSFLPKKREIFVTYMGKCIDEHAGIYSVLKKICFQMIEKFEKGAYVHIHVLYVCRNFRRKLVIILVCVKMTKKCLVKSFVLNTEICLFCGDQIKSYFFTKNYAARMFQRDVHIKFSFGIFTHFNHI